MKHKNIEPELRKVMEFIQNNYTPHHSIIVTYDGFEIVESVKYSFLIDKEAKAFWGEKKES